MFAAVLSAGPSPYYVVLAPNNNAAQNLVLAGLCAAGFHPRVCADVLTSGQRALSFPGTPKDGDEIARLINVIGELDESLVTVGA